MSGPRALAVSLLLALSLMSLVPGSTADLGSIQPGDVAYTSLGGCTLNFVFDGPGGETYIGIAAHCVEEIGEDISTTQYGVFGDVAWIGDADSTTKDFAFIQVRAAFEDVVDANVRGYPDYPSGYTRPIDTSVGDLIQISGYGAGYGLTYPTQTKRVAVHLGDTSTQHRVAGPIHWGDSGGPLVHIKTGKAYGTVSGISLACLCSEYGPTVEGILAHASNAGFPVTLRTV